MRNRLSYRLKNACDVGVKNLIPAVPEKRQARISFNRDVANLVPTSSMLSCWETLDERARLILDRHGTLIAYGELAATMLAESDCLHLQSGILKATSVEANADLKALLSTPDGEVSELILSCRQIEGHCILHATGICATTVALMIQGAHGDFIPRLADLESAFGLTPAETYVVELLLGGRGPSEIGEELNISVHTVRAHLRHCYEKLGVSSREELWQKLGPYRLN